MSRRHKSPTGTHVDYSLLKLKCPFGHELGAILSRHSIYRLTADQLATFRRDEKVDGVELVTAGQPVRGLCPICKQQGVAEYWYEQPWGVIEGHLQAELRDTRSAQRTITLC